MAKASVKLPTSIAEGGVDDVELVPTDNTYPTGAITLTDSDGDTWWTATISDTVDNLNNYDVYVNGSKLSQSEANERWIGNKSIKTHINSDNPHGGSASQTALDNHINDTGNVHSLDLSGYYNSASGVITDINDEVNTDLASLGDIESLDAKVATMITNLDTNVTNLQESVGSLDKLEVVSRRRIGETTSSFTLPPDYTTILSDLLIEKRKDKEIIRVAWEEGATAGRIVIRLNFPDIGTGGYIANWANSDVGFVEILLDSSYANKVHRFDVEGGDPVDGDTEIKNIVVNAL